MSSDATMPAPRSAWRFFPYAIVAGLGFVVMVNIGMVYMALHTFPGIVEKPGAEVSQPATAPAQK